MQHVLVGVKIGDKLPDAAFKAHLVALFLACAQIDGADTQPGIQKGLLPHTGVEHVIVVHCFLEHLRVGLESDRSAGVIRAPDHCHLLDDVTPGKLHLVDFSITVYLHREPFAQGVDYTGAHAVEAAGHLVAAAAEFTAGVEHSVNHLESGPPGLGLDIHGNTAAVILYANSTISLHGDISTVARQSFVDGVVYDLIDQVMQTAFRGGTDIHARTLAHSLQPFEHLDLRSVVLVAFIHVVRLFPLVFLDPFLLFFVHTGTS